MHAISPNDALISINNHYCKPHRNGTKNIKRFRFFNLFWDVTIIVFSNSHILIWDVWKVKTQLSISTIYFSTCSSKIQLCIIPQMENIYHTLFNLFLYFIQFILKLVTRQNELGFWMLRKNLKRQLWTQSTFLPRHDQ